MTNKYVYDNIEVTMTGRTARRELPTRAGRAARHDELVEITPADDEEGSWKKFVREKELYRIEED